MSGTDSYPEAADQPRTPASPPPRGIEPEGASYGPPPPPDFGFVAQQHEASPHAVADHAPASAWGPPDLPPQGKSRPWAIAAIVAVIVGVLIALLWLVAAGIGSILSLDRDPGEAAPTSETDNSGQSDPGTDSAPGSDSVEASLQAKIDEYKTARDTGTLWATIPDTEYNRTALSAFLYLLTDLKIAANFGGDTSDYLDRADELERKLQNQEPLGTDITIKLSDRTFTYDGDTGEGGYTDN